MPEVIPNAVVLLRRQGEKGLREQHPANKATSPTSVLDGRVRRLPWDVAHEKADELTRLCRELNTAFEIVILEGINKEGRIEIQGDQRERIVAELEKLGYLIKRVGG